MPANPRSDNDRPEIVALDGEAATETLARWLAAWQDRCMDIALPHDPFAVTSPEALAALYPAPMERVLKTGRDRGVVICLHATIETILSRAGRHGPTRPLLNVEDPDARARALYAEREPIYKSAGTVILTDGRPLSEVAAHVIRVWRRESQDYARARGSR